MKMESQQEQEQEQHPYASLYEPLLFATEPVEVDTCPSSQEQQEQQKQKPREVFSSSTAAVANQLPPSQLSRTNATTSICRANKKQKIDCSDQNNNIAESAVQSVRLVHEEDARMDLNDQVAHIVKMFLDDDIDDGHDNISGCESVIGDDFNGKTLTRRVKGENISENHNDPYIYDEEKDKDFCSEKMATEESHSQQQQEQHPYMSLYEPLFVATELADEVEVFPSLSLSLSQPDAQSLPRPRITNDTTTSVINWAKRRKNIDYSDESNSNNIIAKNAIQSVDHEKDKRVAVQTVGHEEDKHVAPLLTTLLHDFDIIEDGNGRINNDASTATARSARFESYGECADSGSNVSVRNINTDKGRINNDANNATANARSIRYETYSSFADSVSNILSMRKINTDKIDESWKKMYAKLVAYQIEHNDTLVPVKYNGDPQLGTWVRTQRAAYRDTKITEERKSLLESIGFVWKTGQILAYRSDATWLEMYQQLLAYKNEHNDTKVPSIYKRNPKLGRWVEKQRLLYKKMKMTEERISMLNFIGFVWYVKLQFDNGRWEGMFQRLIAYKMNNKHTIVPNKYNGDQQLGNWVSRQRAMYAEKKMPDIRKSLLNSIAFVWNPNND